MNNPFCISKNKLYKMFWHDKSRDRFDKLIKKFSNKYIVEEMLDQVIREDGEVYDYFTQEIKTFTRTTTSEETASSFNLSDFYFGSNVETEICFEMKRSFSKKTISSYDELANNVECDTFIDCAIQLKNKKRIFQIKGYREDYHAHKTADLIKFLDKKLLGGYGNMSGVIGAVLIQPIPWSNSELDFDEIHKYLNTIKESITFDEIVFIWNEMQKSMVKYEVYPNNNIVKIPLDLPSEKLPSTLREQIIER